VLRLLINLVSVRIVEYVSQVFRYGSSLFQKHHLGSFDDLWNMIVV
jgi:hypothetical protein